jgi:hypothetical protein
MRKGQPKVVDKIKTHILYSITFSENRAFCEIMRKDMVETDRTQMTILYRANTLRAGYLKLQTQTQHM